MIYEQIPTLVIDTVRSLYRPSYVDMDMVAPGRIFESVDTSAVSVFLQNILPPVALVASLFFAGVIVFIKIQKNLLVPPPASAPTPAADSQAALPTGVLRDRWNALLQHLESTHESQWKVAVIEADKLVDDALARAGFPGATFGDRLSNIQPGMLVSLDGVWWAHKIRNRLAHEVDYFLRYTEARQAIGYYEAALSELQLI
jgi:hypothetical protein